MGLEVSDAGVRFGDVVALREASLSLPPGEVMAVLGASGSGKSTLLRAVAGLEPLATGRVRFAGEDLARVPVHRRGFALMFQDGQLFAHLTVAGNVGYPLRLRGQRGTDARSRVEDLLELVGLAGLGDRLPASLSGGQRQRVALARALACRPRLMLLDEPFSALDRSLRGRLSADVREVLRETGTGALMVTHDVDEAYALATRLAVMREGRIVQQGSVAEVDAAPADAKVAGLLGYDSVIGRELAEVVLGGPVRGPLAVRRHAWRLAEAADSPGATAAVIAERMSARGPLLSVRIDTPEQAVEIDVPVQGGSERRPPGSAVRVTADPGGVAPLG